MTPSLCSLKLDCLINTSHIQLFIGGESLSYDLLSKILNKSILIGLMWFDKNTNLWGFINSL